MAGAESKALGPGGATALHMVLAEAVKAVALRTANDINHAHLATSRPKQAPG